MDTQRMQERMHHEIPMSQSLGVTVDSVSSDHVRLRAPLAPNINHQSTAFGGSVNAVAVLSCWAQVTAALVQSGLDVDYIVIQDSAVQYHAPIHRDFEAESSWESDSARDIFFTTLKRRGRARVSLRSVVSCQGRVCADLSGRFVAQLKGV